MPEPRRRAGMGVVSLQQQSAATALHYIGLIRPVQAL